MPGLSTEPEVAFDNSFCNSFRINTYGTSLKC
jgi:hypothetical protein